MDYKLCILAAGKGTRNKYVETNKALLPLGEGTALSYIISKFPPEIEIVIAVGFHGSLVHEYALAKWRERVRFVWVNYEDYGRGPGYSLLKCSLYLQCPFVYIACDTIVTDEIPPPVRNWIGVSLVKEKLPYMTLETEEGLVTKLFDKGDKKATLLAHIGLVGVRHYRAFWESLVQPTIIENEYQDTSGIRGLLSHNLNAIRFHWLDIGTTEGYENAKQYFGKTLSGRTS